MKLNQISKYMFNDQYNNSMRRNKPQSRFETSMNQLALSVEERAIKTAGGSGARSASHKSPMFRSRPMSVKYDLSADHIAASNTNNNNNSDLLDYSSIVDRTERMKRRWLRVIENKEKMQMDTQREMKAKYDKLVKLEKSKKKNREKEIADREFFIEKKKEKLHHIQKNREHVVHEFEKALQLKE